MRENLSAAPFPVWEGAARGLYAVIFRCGDGAGIAAVERGGDISKALAVLPLMRGFYYKKHQSKNQKHKKSDVVKNYCGAISKSVE